MPNSATHIPNPAHVAIKGEQPGFCPGESWPWHIQLDSHSTVVEMALLMTRYGCDCRVITADLTVLVPRSPDLPCPSAQGVSELFIHGLAALRQGRFTPIRFSAGG